MARLAEMTPVEVRRALDAGKDCAILPLGSVEQHGPHLLLTCDSYNALALAVRTADLADAICFPQFPFSWIGGTRTFSGGLNVRLELQHELLWEVLDGIARTAFRCALLVNCHGGVSTLIPSLAREYFKKNGMPVGSVYISQLWRNVEGATDFFRRSDHEASLLTASLRLLGRDDLVDKIRADTARALAEYGDLRRADPPPTFEARVQRQTRRILTVGHPYTHECMHVQPTRDVDTEGALRLIEAGAQRLALLVADLRAR